MNIGFSPIIAITSPLTTVKAGYSKGISPDNSSERSDEPKKSQPNESSPQARREALNDPNSALFKELQALKNRDREVRNHEQAHLAAAGPYALSGTNFQYRQGPDGQRYAIGGDVKIDTSKVTGNPEATLRKAEVVLRAALAPAEPSPQDRSIAAQASSLANSAQQELPQLRQQEAQQSRTERQGGNNESSASNEKPTAALEKLEGDIRNTGALGNPEPNLDLIV